MEKNDAEFNRGSPYENLIMRILFSENPEHKDNYLYSEYPVHSSGQARGFLHLGNYERTLLGKFLSPILPAICISGDMGSGKSTTFHHLMEYYLKNRLVRRIEPINPSKRSRSTQKTILLGFIDLRSFINEKGPEENFNKLFTLITDEMRAKISFLVDREHEFINFWDLISEKYLSGELDTSEVARKIQSGLSGSGADYSNIQFREMLYEELMKDKEYYFRYLLLLWRTISDRKSQNLVLISSQQYHITHSLFVIDNLDSLPEALQRWLYDLVLTSVEKSSPTFILFLRPETLTRLGRSDNVFDHVSHSSITPHTVVVNQLQKFLNNPGKIFRLDKNLSKEEQQQVIDFISRMLPELNDGTGAFREFLSSACGNSIRLGQNIAQGVLLFPTSELGKADVSTHYIIRSCIRQGRPSYHYSAHSPIENLFAVDYSNRSNILLKPRILKYLYHDSNLIDLEQIHGTEYLEDNADNIYHRYCRLENQLRNDFVAMNYKAIAVREAIFQLARQNCQLVFTSGYDIKRPTWGDEQEVIYLTKIGIGYTTNLLHNYDYLQEVMVEIIANIPGFPTPITDKLSERAYALCRFLRYLRERDHEEMEFVIKKFKSPLWYTTNFGDLMVSTEIIQNVYPTIGKIFQSSITKNPQARNMYQELLYDFESELRLAEKANQDFLGTEIQLVDGFTFK